MCIYIFLYWMFFIIKMNFILKVLFFIFITNEITNCLRICHVNEKNCKISYDSVEGYKPICEKLDCEGEYR